MATTNNAEDYICSKNDVSNLLRVPVEILEHILCFPSLNCRDILNVSQCCSKLNKLCQSNDLWKRKLQQNLINGVLKKLEDEAFAILIARIWQMQSWLPCQMQFICGGCQLLPSPQRVLHFLHRPDRWPHMLSRYDRNKVFDWHEEYRQRNRFVQIVWTKVAEFSLKFYTCDEISKEDFSDFSILMDEHQLAGEFLIDELMSLIHSDRSKNLTLRYYGEKILRFIQHTMLPKKIRSFMSLPPDQQCLELGAVLVAQWCQPSEDITINEICDQLDSLANDVKCLLQQTHPHHPVLSTQFDHHVINDNLWTCDQCQILLEALNDTLYSKYGFLGNQKDYYSKENSYIDKVIKLRMGIPITMCIVYSAIARRLGIMCEPVNAPSHFLLRWKQHPMSTQEQMYTYIDVFNGGTFLTYADLPQELNIPQYSMTLDSIRITQPSQVLQRMLRNLIAIGREQGGMGDNLLCLRSALELSRLIMPDDFELRMQLIRVNLHLHINFTDVIDSLQTIADDDQNRVGLVTYLMNTAKTQMEERKKKLEEIKLKIKTRKTPEEVKFPVGLIMKHKRYGYNCVIYGWDNKCEATAEWITQMGVNELPNKDQQPFYNVLVEDGTNRYAAEENLTINLKPCAVSHPEVGKYFESYEGGYYTPNNEKATEYPEDLKLLKQMVQGSDNT